MDSFEDVGIGMISNLKRKLNLVHIVELAGVELKRLGTRYVGICPFHNEKIPSFFVFDEARFKCFGCGEHGDVIDFVQKIYGLSFKDALTRLGVERGELSKSVIKKINQRKRRRKLFDDFNKWRGDRLAELGTLINRTRQLMANGIPPEDLDLYAPLLDRLPLWEHHSEVLLNGSDKEKFKVFKQEGHKWKRNLKKQTSI